VGSEVRVSGAVDSRCASRVMVVISCKEQNRKLIQKMGSARKRSTNLRILDE
jgi:hypothetical protein